MRSVRKGGVTRSRAPSIARLHRPQALRTDTGQARTRKRASVRLARLCGVGLRSRKNDKATTEKVWPLGGTHDLFFAGTTASEDRIHAV
jgi:hypothetical protein